MKNIIKIFVVAIIATLCLISCDRNKYPYVNYVVEGRVIDKITKEPIKDILVSIHIRELPNLDDSQRVIFKLSPPPDSWLSDKKGEFSTSSSYISPIYFYDYENGLYKDTIIFVDFRGVSLSGIPNGNYRGSYVLNIGDVELEKID